MKQAVLWSALAVASLLAMVPDHVGAETSIVDDQDPAVDAALGLEAPNGNFVIVDLVHSMLAKRDGGQADDEEVRERVVDLLAQYITINANPLVYSTLHPSQQRKVAAIGQWALDNEIAGQMRGFSELEPAVIRAASCLVEAGSGGLETLRNCIQACSNADETANATEIHAKN